MPVQLPVQLPVQSGKSDARSPPPFARARAKPTPHPAGPPDVPTTPRPPSSWASATNLDSPEDTRHDVDTHPLETVPYSTKHPLTSANK
ncbi:hypothetical protein GONAM_16_00290 [Gordonia namibiensis NBRC 108229]|uniref:Uncharacterized protein n=1 Tax=Gordonia namibiensis NBRC 108229 TaxID=1208314 RepID=K6XNW0_9ACTN|nr:hypothetical protein GONAM_16_00290 [Gordonia namibiensis NBRC 108229]